MVDLTNEKKSLCKLNSQASWQQMYKTKTFIQYQNNVFKVQKYSQQLKNTETSRDFLKAQNNRFVKKVLLFWLHEYCMTNFKNGP